MNNNPRELVKKMNISSNAIIINQCSETSYEEFIYNNHSIKVYNFNEKGIGLSRNNGIMRTNADIVLFADDDEVLVDNYSLTCDYAKRSYLLCISYATMTPLYLLLSWMFKRWINKLNLKIKMTKQKVVYLQFKK